MPAPEEGHGLASLATAEEEQDAYEQEDVDGDDYDDDDDDDEGYEFDDAADATQCVEMAERSPGVSGPTVSIRDFEAIAALQRKRKPVPGERDESSKRSRQQGVEPSEAESANLFDQLMEGFGLRRKKKRKSKDGRKRGRAKGTRNRCSPEVIKKLGDATLLFTENRFKEAIPILHEIVRIAPNLPNSYNLLGSICKERGDIDKAINFVIIAACISPKDVSLWKKLIDLALKTEDAKLARYCAIRAMKADPEDVGLKFDCANIYRTLQYYHKAAEVYEQIVRMYPSNVVARKTAAQMYRDSAQIDKAIDLLEGFVINAQTTNVDWGLLDLLISLYLRNNDHTEALRQIEKAHQVLGSQHKLPMWLQAKEVICQAYLGDMKHAEVFLQDVSLERSRENADLITEVASALENLGQYEYALRFYSMIEDVAVHNDGSSYVKVAQCYMVMGEKGKAIPYLYKALERMEGNVEVRITLSSLLVDENKSDDAISMLSPPDNPESQSANTPDKQKPWWLDGEVKMQLAKLYYNKGKMQEFVDTIFLPILETLDIEYANRKIKVTKKLTNDVLQERTKVLGEVRPNSVFQGCRPLASPAQLLKANRAKKLLEKRGASNDEDTIKHNTRRAKQIPPLPGLLTNVENHQLVLDLCRTLTLLQQYFEALQIINHALKLGNDPLSDDNKEELRSLGAEIAYRAPDPSPGFDYVRYVVQKHPHSLSAWNSYYKVTSRQDEKRHVKFLLRARRDPNSVPPKIISGNRFTSIKQHQSATRDYLEAYKLDPENPFINLCVGSSLVNLSLGFRLQNKNQCIVQAFAFLYQCLRIGSNRQEALYNIARAYHHVGLKTLAVIYYEKVLDMEVKDQPIPKLPFDVDSDLSGQQQQDVRPGYCDLRREAAFNLHLIYRESGATDLARRILKTYCSI